ncbi:MAG: multiheme c-type cytochrome [Candidatus Krumholzibacteriia bacterium]
MRKRISLLSRGAVGVLIVTLALVIAVHADEKAEHKYVGVKKCGMCHKAKAKGNQLGKWEDSKHAKAFETLATEKALQFAKERGLDKPPQESDECLKCHVTGHGKPAELFEASFKKELGVQCESCHGPGSDYKKMKIMKDREIAVAAGLVIPDEKTYKQCHNEESPAYKGFDFEERFALIAHPNPKKKKKKTE